MAPANVIGLTGTLFNTTAFCGYGAAVVVGGPILERPLFCAPLPALASSPDRSPPSHCGPSEPSQASQPSQPLRALRPRLP